jgi:hypothetical protein
VDHWILASENDGICEVPLFDGMSPDEWQANLRLIAAAPELLAALQELVGYSDEVSFTGMAVALKRARAAIAIATGEEG